MKYATIAATNTLLARLRATLPNRSVSFGDALQLASHHAFKVRQWCGDQEPCINLAWLLNQRAVPVHRVPRYQLGEHTSGLTTDQLDNRLQMFVCQNEPRARQRFTLAHEFYHAITFTQPTHCMPDWVAAVPSAAMTKLRQCATISRPTCSCQ